MIRAVLDTNVIVSSVISQKGAPFQLMQAWADFRFALITTESILEEVQRVLSEPRVKGVFHITDEQIYQLVRVLRQDAILVPGNADASGASPQDPSDEMFLAAAMDGEASAVVSGDKRLLQLGMYQGMPILTPRQFLDLLEGTSS